VDEQKVCVEFMNLKGDSYKFLEHFRKFKDTDLNFMNDAVEK